MVLSAMLGDFVTVRDWLPAGKTGAVVFTIDDVHPATSTDAYEAGGDLGQGALGHLERLLDRHPQLAMTLFVTPDWREISPVPTRRWVARIPFVRDLFFLAPILSEGTMRLDRHPAFVSYLNEFPRTEIALHGFQHVHRGPKIPVEFQDESREKCADKLRRAMDVFRAARLPFSPGLQPPGWDMSPALIEACQDVGLRWVCSARDVRSEPSDTAVTGMSGLNGASLIHPTALNGGRLIHVTSNFQATSQVERALAILDHGGVLSVKGHIVKLAMGYLALDGVDDAYCNYLDLLFSELERRYGDRLLWTTVGQIAKLAVNALPEDRRPAGDSAAADPG